MRDKRKENKQEWAFIFKHIYNFKNTNTYTLLESRQGCQITHKVKYVPIVQTYWLKYPFLKEVMCLNGLQR